MLLFSTILEINDSMTRDAFIRLVIEWNQGNPYQANVIPGIEWNGERNIRYGNDQLWLGIEEYRNRNIIAARFEKKEEDGTVWDSDYVMDFDAMRMSVRLDRSYTEEALSPDPKFSTPYFITLLIDRGYLQQDAALPVLRVPVTVSEQNLELAADVITGREKFRLPVVYVSKTDYDEDPVDVGTLAYRLKGIAHVLVESSNVCNTRLRELCDDQNEYYGAVGIYYPTKSIPHRRYLYRSSYGYDAYLLERVVRSVLQYSNSQMVDTLFTWQGVNNALLLDRLQSKREDLLAAEQAQRAAEAEAARIQGTLDEEERKRRQAEDERDDTNKLMEGVDDEIQRYRHQIEELTRANEALQYENQGLKIKLDARDEIPVLFQGDEVELYPGEIRDLLLAMLSEALRGTAPKSRRADIARDIIDRNDYQGISEAKAEKVKKLFRNYDGMTGKVRQELKDLGFDITEDGKHYKMTYYGDSRYQVTFSKTPSDVRSGKNSAQQTINTVF